MELDQESRMLHPGVGSGEQDATSWSGFKRVGCYILEWAQESKMLHPGVGSRE